MNYNKNNMYPFTKKYCREITWAIEVNGRHYFDQCVMPKDYKGRDVSVDFPTSLLHDFVHRRYGSSHPSRISISHSNGRLPPTMGVHQETGTEERTILAQEEEQEPTGGDMRTNSIITIITQEEPKSGEVGMNSDLTTITLRVIRGSHQMFRRWKWIQKFTQEW